MGFDLIGVKPLNKDGEYFRNNIWWWRRLWRFSVMVANQSITDEEHGRGYHNDGLLIDGHKHADLLKGLKYAYANKNKFKKYIKLEDEFLNPNRKEINYPFSWKNVKDFIKFLENNKGFEIW